MSTFISSVSYQSKLLLAELSVHSGAQISPSVVTTKWPFEGQNSLAWQNDLELATPASRAVTMDTRNGICLDSRLGCDCVDQERIPEVMASPL